LEEFNIQPITLSDSEWITCLLRDRWGSSHVVSRGKVYHADQLPGFVATYRDEKVGLITYSFHGTACEIVTFDSVRENRGVGSALLKAVEALARQAGCTCLRLVTTNDNLKALRFYQKRGFTLIALHRNAVEHSRTLKPEIPMRGNDGIPIRDELELELPL
jgi:ribosomal protein S18 acetylase RimI-like enzyme